MLVTCFSDRGVEVWMAGCWAATPAEYATPPTVVATARVAIPVRTSRRDGRRQERLNMISPMDGPNACRSKLTPARPNDSAAAPISGETCGAGHRVQPLACCTSVVEVRVEDPDLGDLRDRQAVGLGRAPDRLRRRAVVHAVRRPVVRRHVGVHPGDVVPRVALDDVQT